MFAFFLSELRNSAAVVESSLGLHLPTRTGFYYCGLELPGQVIFVQRKWAATVGVGDVGRQHVDWGHEVIVPGCMHMLWWRQGDVLRGVINMYLDSHSPGERVWQLRESVDKLRNFKRRNANGQRCEFIFGGDRTCITSPEQRLSSDPTGSWFPGGPTLEAWSNFLQEQGAGALVEQTEFTWQRISAMANGERRFVRRFSMLRGYRWSGGVI